MVSRIKYDLIDSKCTFASQHGRDIYFKPLRFKCNNRMKYELSLLELFQRKIGKIITISRLKAIFIWFYREHSDLYFYFDRCSLVLKLELRFR